MKIGFNATGINPNYSGGVNTFSIGLLNGLIKELNGYSLQIYATELNKNYFEKFKTKNVDVIVLPFNSYQIKFYYTLVTVLTYLNIESIHEAVVNYVYRKWAKVISEKSNLIYTPTSTMLPYKFNIPTVLSIHDIQQAIYPQFFSKRELLRRRITYALSIKNSTLIQASSSFMRDHLLEYYGFLDKEKIKVIPEGVDILRFSVKHKESIIEKYRIPIKFLYYPAQLWPHKDHVTLLRALNALNARGVKIPLVMTGSAYKGSKVIFEYIEKHNLDFVYYLGKVSEEDVVSLYQEAWYFITATLYESSSLPFLEAAAANALIIASRTPPNIEMEINIKAELFEPNNFSELEKLLHRLWIDNSSSDEKKKINSNRVKSYSWNEIAKKYIDIFKRT